MAIRRKLFASIAMLMGFIFSTVAFASDLNMRPGVTETSIEAFDLHMQVIYVMTVIAIVVFGAMFYSFIFHRKSKNPKPATWSHSTKMEIIWTAIPVLILIYLTIPAIKLLLKMEESKTDADLTIQITGIQWKWEYMYPEQNITFISSLSTPRDQIDSGSDKGENYLLEVDNELVIPAGKTVRFLVTADDVIHSWW
ncbi:MAG: cytochrome c oxidase subunit II, partial [Gammaproteobacteria bacterium]|nr:cytochrome c oxidase subunit II [Gammaproteobacteria bacterium]